MQSSRQLRANPFNSHCFIEEGDDSDDNVISLVW